MKLHCRALRRGAASGWAEEMTHLQMLSSAQMRKNPQIRHFSGIHEDSLCSAGLASGGSAPAAACSAAPPPCPTLPSCGGFCLLYKTHLVPLTLLLSRWATSFLTQPSPHVPDLLCRRGQVPGVWRRAPRPCFPTPSLFSLQADIVFSCWESTVPCLAVYMVSLYCKLEVWSQHAWVKPCLL